MLSSTSFPLLRYGAAAWASVLALLASVMLDRMIEPLPFPLFLAAVTFSAWYGGIGPALLATSVGILATQYIVVIQQFAITEAMTLADPRALGESVAFLLVAILVSSLQAGMRGAHRRAQQAATLFRHLQVVTDAAMTHINLDELLTDLLSRIRQILAVDFVEVLLPTEDGQHLVTRASLGLGSELARDRQLPIGAAIAQRRPSSRGLLASKQPPVTETAIEDQQELSLVGAPLLLGDRVIGLLQVGTAQDRRFTREDTRMLQLLAGRMALAVEHGRLSEAERTARAAAEAAQQRFAFLAEASTRFAESLDYEAILASVTGLVVPQLADWCVVDVLESDGSMRRLESACADAARPELAQQIQRCYPLDSRGQLGVARVVHTGRPELCPHVSEAVSTAGVGEAEQLQLLLGLGVSSLMCVPLLARGRTLGTITLMSAESGREYGADDLSLAEALARRCALAVDNAWLYRQAQQSIRVRDEFLANAAHELKTPVATIHGYVELLQQWTPEDRERRQPQALEAVGRQCERLRRLTQEMLEISRLELGNLQLNRQQFELGELAGEVLQRIRATTPRHRMLLYSETGVVVDADRDRIEQVTGHLLHNAIKFSPNGTDIELRVSSREGEALVSVQDKGIGIPKERQSHLFERYYRAHAGTVYDTGGMGIGLHLCWELIARHGGRTWFKSEEGRGSTFSFSIPLANRDADGRP